MGDCLVICEDGEYLCDNTDGTPSGGDMCYCSDCDSREHEEDMVSVGLNGSRMVCAHCAANNYSYGYGRMGYEYHIPEEYVICVDGEYYDTRYLSDNHIVELECGDYEHRDNAFVCPVDGNWYHNDEGVMTEDKGMCYEDNTWRCAHTGNDWSDDTEPELVNGETVHPDEVEAYLESLDADELAAYEASKVEHELQVDLPLSEPEPVPTPSWTSVDTSVVEHKVVTMSSTDMDYVFAALRMVEGRNSWPFAMTLSAPYTNDE